MSMRPQERERRKSASQLHGALEGGADRLRSHPYFAAVAVITQDDGDIDTLIAKKLGSLGIVATVIFREAECPAPNVPGPSIERLSIIVEVAENTATNKSGRTCLEVVERVLRRLHLYKEEESGALYTCASRPVYPSTPPRPANVCYHCAFDVALELIMLPLGDDAAE